MGAERKNPDGDNVLMENRKRKRRAMTILSSVVLSRLIPTGSGEERDRFRMRIISKAVQLVKI
jgi:hypothetical protein